MRPLRPARTLVRSVAAPAASVVLVLALAGCGGDSDDGGSGDSGGSGGARSAESLQEDLITADDLPDGFVDTTEEDDDEDDADTGTCLDDIAEFEDQVEVEPEADAEVELTLESEQGQSQVTSTLESYADADELGGVIDDYVAVAQGCTRAEGEDADGVTYDLTLETDEEVTVEGADRQVSVDVTGTLSAQGQSFPVTFGFVVTAAGTTLAAVGVSDVGEADAAGQIDEITQTQLDKVLG